jgi:hypothetical protein
MLANSILPRDFGSTMQALLSFKKMKAKPKKTHPQKINYSWKNKKGSWDI